MPDLNHIKPDEESHYNGLDGHDALGQNNQRAPGKAIADHAT
jgi:hypothetical protein